MYCVESNNPPVLFGNFDPEITFEYTKSMRKFRCDTKYAPNTIRFYRITPAFCPINRVSHSHGARPIIGPNIFADLRSTKDERRMIPKKDTSPA